MRRPNCCLAAPLRGRASRAAAAARERDLISTCKRESLRRSRRCRSQPPAPTHPIWMGIKKAGKKNETREERAAFLMFSALPSELPHFSALGERNRGVDAPPRERQSGGEEKGSAAEMERWRVGSRSSLCRKLIGADSSGFSVCHFYDEASSLLMEELLESPLDERNVSGLHTWEPPDARSIWTGVGFCLK